MISLDSIRQPVLKELDAYEAFLERQFTAEGDLLNEMLQHALSSRGYKNPALNNLVYQHQ